MSSNLTNRQQNLVVNYVKSNFSAHKAALQSDYTANTAKVESHEMIAKPKIKERLACALGDRDSLFMKELGMTLEWQMRKLRRVVEDGIPEEGELKSHKVKVAISAIDLINKIQGNYAPDRQLRITVDATQEKIEEAQRVYKEY